ncbi:hypothetical protein Y5W_00903 [Alcanivorax sp. 521-1]|uniref:Porin family protein n=2 Tax=Pseudomonadota TaxID=1224 RepID=A0A3B9IR75_9PROT|nr:porin family protein [Alloalcanivorax profundimaris]MAO60958.1 hypothetical protein [Alcanivorax sp.]MBM1145507.1 porin family protein [Alcanivorax sp. ZXX171]MCQ6263204.1 porin family protein [Alcanivorax sp. MM125-6]UWN49229.1 hypothetical protein ASALC70_01428 [Alcanivorax sp. ALC70]HAE49837.1 porin family protein [Tistrella mobilis]|tara:strand:- start:355 stop:909 length:555 start_codon:yes stop_codon:yes gene_type:complete
MKVKILGKVMVLSCSLVAGGAFAAGPYIGANYSQFQYDNDDVEGGDTLKIDSAVLRAGFEFNDYLGIEARGGMGFESDKKEAALGTFEYDMDNMYGGYVKLSAPLAESVHPYIIGGYTKIKADVKYTLGSVSTDESERYEGESYGAGIDFNLTDTVGANLEYMRYYDQDEEEISGISVGLRSAF